MNPFPRCHVTGKIGHAERSGADTHLVLLVRKFNYQGRIYRCPFCALLHIGTHRNYKKGKMEVAA